MRANLLALEHTVVRTGGVALIAGAIAFLGVFAFGVDSPLAPRSHSRTNASKP